MILDKMKLDGKTAIVTGASRGLGMGMAMGLAEAGADVALVSRNLSALEEVASQVQAVGRTAMPIECDVADISQIETMVERAHNHFGKIDVLVNNAGTTARMPAEDFTEEAWDHVMNLNIKGAFFCAKAVAKRMIPRKKGKIINTASLSSVVGLRFVPAYVASKGGISQLTKALAVEWAEHNINVNAIGPGYYKTEMTKPIQEDDERNAWVLSRIPMGRWGDPEDLKGVVVFLASEASDYLTGQTIFVDGGWLAS